jgi:hypothetical protein
MDADGYRRKANRYAELAVTAGDETQRNLLTQVALRWQRLAEHAEPDPYGDDEPRLVLP